MSVESDEHGTVDPVDGRLELLRALADPSRLQLVDALLDRPHCVEELAERLGRAASTVSFHLRKLEEVGLVTKSRTQYYLVYALRPEPLAWTLRELIGLTPAVEAGVRGATPSFRDQVLRAFFRGGQLTQLPRQWRKRRVVLEQFLRLFDRGRRYGEAEVDELIGALHSDYCTIRRLLVDEGYLEREQGQYWLGASSEEVTVDNRKDIIRQYKERPRRAGIYQVRNTRSGRVLLGSTTNLHGPLNRHRFMLSIGTHGNAALQRDWNELGAEAFAFEELEVIEPREDPDFSVEDELVALERRWLEKVQPLAERTYNASPDLRL